MQKRRIALLVVLAFALALTAESSRILEDGEQLFPAKQLLRLVARSKRCNSYRHILLIHSCDDQALTCSKLRWPVVADFQP